MTTISFQDPTTGAVTNIGSDMSGVSVRIPERKVLRRDSKKINPVSILLQDISDLDMMVCKARRAQFVENSLIHQSKRDITEWMDLLSTMSVKDLARDQEFETDLSSIRALCDLHELHLSIVEPWTSDEYVPTLAKFFSFSNNAMCVSGKV